jgi:hypothetical protein
MLRNGPIAIFLGCTVVPLLSSVLLFTVLVIHDQLWCENIKWKISEVKKICKQNKIYYNIIIIILPYLLLLLNSYYI